MIVNVNGVIRQATQKEEEELIAAFEAMSHEQLNSALDLKTCTECGKIINANEVRENDANSAA